MLDMILGRLIAVPHRVLRVAMRDEGLVRGVGVVLVRVMLRCLPMMRGSNARDARPPRHDVRCPSKLWPFFRPNSLA